MPIDLESGDQWASIIAAAVAVLAAAAALTRWAWQRSIPYRARRQASRSNQTQAIIQRIKYCDPIALGVHRAIQDISDGRKMKRPDVLPAYIKRDFDDDLVMALSRCMRSSGLILLVGTSSTGKTRSAYEALKSVMPNWKVVQPITPQRLLAVLTEISNWKKTIIWLNEAQDYLDAGEGNELAAQLIRLLADATSFIVVGTLWPDKYHELINEGISNNGGVSKSARRSLLHSAIIVPVGTQLSAAEMRTARELAQQDSSLRLAIDYGGHKIMQSLAAGPDLIHHWETSPTPQASAVLTAAIDARMLGVNGPLTRNFLRSGATAYLSGHDRAGLLSDGQIFEAALQYARSPLKGAVYALNEITSPRGRTLGYRIADYLHEYGASLRLLAEIGSEFWAALEKHIVDPSDLFKLGEAAKITNELEWAEMLFKKAIKLGSKEASVELAHMFAAQLRITEADLILSEAVENGDTNAWLTHFRLLRSQGRLVDAERTLRRAIQLKAPWSISSSGRVSKYGIEHYGPVLGFSTNVYQFGPRSELTDLLLSQGRHEDAIVTWREAVEADENYARQHLARLLTEHGLVDEAEDNLARATMSGEPGARYQLAVLLEEQGRANDVMEVWQEGILLKEARSAQNLGEFLLKIGRAADAERVLRTAVDREDGEAWIDLLELYTKQGRQGEVESLLHRAIEREFPGARSEMAVFLQERGRTADVRGLLGAAIEAGEKDAWKRLAEFFIDTEANQLAAVPVLRNAATRKERDADSILATLLTLHSSYDEAEQIRLRMVATGEYRARFGLAGFYAGQGRFDDAERVLREAVRHSETHAREYLADFLTAQNRSADVQLLWREGIATGDWHARENLAQLLENENRLGDVEEILQEAIVAGELNAHQNLATFFMKHARYREAEAVLRKGLDIGETYILHHLVSLLVMEGRFDEARGEIGKYKERGLFDAFSLEASIFQAEGREGEARQALGEAVRRHEWMADEKLLDLAFEETEPSDLDGEPALISPYAVQKLIEAGDASKAKKVLNGLLAIKSPWKATEHADLLVRLGDESSAEALLRWAIIRQGWHPRTDLATHLRKRGRLEEAYKVARQAVIMQEYGALIELSAVQISRNEYESAIAVLWEATARGERFAADRLTFLLNSASP